MKIGQIRPVRLQAAKQHAQRETVRPYWTRYDFRYEVQEVPVNQPNRAVRPAPKEMTLNLSLGSGFRPYRAVSFPIGGGRFDRLKFSVSETP
jgi:hypothetical protein